MNLESLKAQIDEETLLLIDAKEKADKIERSVIKNTELHRMLSEIYVLIDKKEVK